MIIRRTRLLLSVALAAVLAPAAFAASIDPVHFQELKWRSVGPYRGGRVLAVTGAPNDPRRFYFGGVNGGVWRTDDAGRTWQPIFDAVNAGSIGAIAVAPSAPDTIYVGTGEADMRSDIAQGIGMFRSSDGGAHWSAIGLGDSQQIGKILVDPRHSDRLLVAALGHPYGPNAERGVFRSTDGGRHWTKTLFKNADTGAIDMVSEPGNPNVVYAALWQARRPPWSVYAPSSGPGSGIYKSVDGGVSWRPLTGHGLPPSAGRIGLTTSEAKPHRVFALIDGDQAGLYRSDNSGTSWTRVSADKRITARAWYFSGITADPKNADRVWVNDTIILRSDDGGANFIPIKGDPTGDDFHTLWIDPRNSDRRILGVDQGALVTVNGGKTWSSWFNQPTGQFYHVVTDNRFPYLIYGAQQDSGAAAIPSRSDSKEDGITMTQFHEVTAGGESDEIAPDPDNPDIVFGGRVDRLDVKSGQTRSVDPTLAFPGQYRGEWTQPLTFGKRDHALYFANQRIFRTTDGGQNWTPISPDLTRTELSIPATLDEPTANDSGEKGPRRGVVYDIATSPLQDGLIWAGTDDGLIWRTGNGGGHWDNVTPAGLSAWSKIGIVEPSHFDARTAYAAIDRHRIDDQMPYIVRTRDGGRSWQPIAAGLPADGGPNSVNVVREDPVQRGLLYAGTERGAFVSFDDGERWQQLASGLPATSVRDITVHGDDVVIATHGRGFYVLDDVVALRALAADPRAATRLFPLANAIRINAPDFTGTPMPKDEPLAINPPFGATIDYDLAGPLQGPVQVAIYDARGGLVDRFSSTDPVKPIDLAKLEIAPEWVTSQRPPATGSGHHRFVWDLHYAKPTGLPGDANLPGVWVPPGRYTVELSANGRSYRQPLTVLADPRIRVTQADFDAQYGLARAVEAARVRARNILAQAGALKGKLTAEQEGQALAITGSAVQYGETTSPTTLTGVSDRLDALAKAVEGGDGAPTADALRGYAILKRALDELDARWRALHFG